MSKHQFEITDPARELFDLGNELKAQKQIKDHAQSYYCFAAYVGLKPDSNELIELIAAVIGRLNKLSDFAKTLQDARLFDEHKTNIVAASNSFAQLFHPQHLSMGWDDAKKRFLDDARLNSFLWFSPIVREAKPLKRLSNEERDAALNEIAGAITEIEEGSESSWLREPLLDGLRPLHFTMKYLHIFGHETAQNEILLLQQKARLFGESDGVISLTQRLPILRVLKVVALVGALFCLPHQILTALPHYRDLLLSAVQEAEFKQQRPLLPPPEPSRSAIQSPAISETKPK